MYHGKQSIGVGIRIRLALVQVDAGTPKLRIAATRDDCAWSIGTKFVLNVVECPNNFLAEGGSQTVLGGALEGDDEDVAMPF